VLSDDSKVSPSTTTDAPALIGAQSAMKHQEVNLESLDVLFDFFVKHSANTFSVRTTSSVRLMVLCKLHATTASIYGVQAY